MFEQEYPVITTEEKTIDISPLEKPQPKLIDSVRKEEVWSEQVVFISFKDEHKMTLITILKSMLYEFKDVNQRTAIDQILNSLTTEDWMPTKIALNLKRMLDLRMKHCTKVLADIHQMATIYPSAVTSHTDDGLSFGMFINTHWVYTDNVKPWCNMYHNTATIEFMQYCSNGIVEAVTNIKDELEF